MRSIVHRRYLNLVLSLSQHGSTVPMYLSKDNNEAVDQETIKCLCLYADWYVGDCDPIRTGLCDSYETFGLPMRLALHLSYHPLLIALINIFRNAREGRGFKYAVTQEKGKIVMTCRSDIANEEARHYQQQIDNYPKGTRFRGRRIIWNNTEGTYSNVKLEEFMQPPASDQVAENTSYVRVTISEVPPEESL